MTKAIRAGKMLDGDALSPAALAQLGRDVSQATTAEVKAFISDTSGSVPLSLGRVEEMRGRVTEEVGQKGAWNSNLNGDLPPNTDISVNRYTYRTDANGQVTNVNGTLTPEIADRNTYQQG